jgi:nicotinamide mononucleotide adenylyltransferase
MKHFVSLKGQPIHKGHCYLIKTMLSEAEEEDDLIIGIVNPFPHEKMDLSKNKKPENFSPVKNPLTYYERLYVLQTFLKSLYEEGEKRAFDVLITPYFVPTIFELNQTYNYLDIKHETVEYISNKDAFELGKEKELDAIGVRVRFVNPVCDRLGKALSSDSIRDAIVKGEDVSPYIEPCIINAMNKMNLFEKIKERRADYSATNGLKP